MASTNGDLRKRAGPAASSKPSTIPGTPVSADDLFSTSKGAPKSTETRSPSYLLLEALRTLAGLALLGVATSYLLTSGRSYTFGLTDPSTLPSFLQPSTLRRSFSGPVTLTTSELARHDGSDPSLPLYISLNRSIYDVSASRHIYGPGGMYGVFGGRDASRAFVTGCFEPEVDLVPYLEGVEEMYVPLWLSRRSEADEGIKAEWAEVLETAGQAVAGKSAKDVITDVKARLGEETVKAMREDAYASGRERVRATMANWAGMLERKNYPVVGRLSEPAEAEDPIKARAKDLPFCKDALKNRPGMTESLTRAMAAMMKEGKLDVEKLVGGADVDPKAREAVKEQLAKIQAQRQKERGQAQGGSGQGGAPPHGAHNPHAGGAARAGGAMPADHAHMMAAGGANPHAPAHHHGGANPHGDKVLGHNEAGQAAEAVGGVPGGGKIKATA